MGWIAVKDGLPVIPEGMYGVRAIVAVFDAVFEDLHPGQGYEVYEASFYDGRFETLAGDRWFPIVDEVTHWMPLPKPPKRHT